MDALMGRVAGMFGRAEPRATARRMVTGLASDLARKNCWTLSEHVGDETPYAMQHLLSRASWDEDAVLDELRSHVVEHLGDRDVVAVVDETGDLKKGVMTVGVQRQYSGTAGRIENCQVAVYLTYSTPRGHTLIDRELYLPKSWTEDPERCADAGIPDEDAVFATKPALAQQMITRTLDAGVRLDWVAGDEVYGADPNLRSECESRSLGYVLAIGQNRRVDPGTGPVRADIAVAGLPKRAWQRLSAGDGAKGPRFYDWAWLEIATDTDTPGHRWLLARRNNSTGEMAYYRCYSPRPVALAVLIAVAGRRWNVEEDFQSGKGLAGLDEHQVTSWTSWRRWTVLSMLALAFLTITAVLAQTDPTPPDLIPLTRNEIRHLYTSTARTPAHQLTRILRRSTWRRRHQQTAKTCHYQRRSQQT
jgi:SRSO17 transposase